jgi:hypothetical protein
MKPNPKEINIILNILNWAQFEFLPRAPFYIDTPLYTRDCPHEQRARNWIKSSTYSNPFFFSCTVILRWTVCCLMSDEFGCKKDMDRRGLFKKTIKRFPWKTKRYSISITDLWVAIYILDLHVPYTKCACWHRLRRSEIYILKLTSLHNIIWTDHVSSRHVI